MNNHVLKSRINWNLWAPPLFFLVVLIIEKETLGTYYSAWLYGLILILYGIIYSCRYRLVHPAILFCLAGLTLWHYMLAAHFDITLKMVRIAGLDIGADPGKNPFSMLTWILNLIVFLVSVAVFGPVLFKALQLEQSSRKLFRMAAQTVTSATNGFTSRPFHAGDAGCTKDQITGFVQYLSALGSVRVIFRDEGTYLTFSMGKSPLAAKDPSETSYLLFDQACGLTVNIASGDYRKFSREFTFERLCGAVAGVFKRYIQYYVDGQESRILKELK